MNKPASVVSPLMRELSAYIAAAPKRALPPDVVETGKHHILDTLAAMVSGCKLRPGKRAISYVKTLGGTKEAHVIGTRMMTSASNAALANGMFAHADETDDVHSLSNMHPGASIVPAALAVAERERRHGKSLLRAVVLGYDIGCRVPQALHTEAFKAAGHVNQSFGGIFGAACAAGALMKLDARQVRHLLSYTAQQASGVRTFERDGEHILKAFMFGGMTGHNGVAAATMVAAGFSGVEDEFTGERNRNFFSAYAPNASPEEMVRGLGTTYEIMNTGIKKWPVGAPVQAALESLLVLMKAHKIKAEDVSKLRVQIPDNGMIVNNSHMPDINIQHLLAVMLLDGTLTFVSTHDVSRMQDSRVLSLKKRIDVIGSAELTAARPPRQCIMEMTTRDGRQLKHRTHAVKGTIANPMNREEVAEKAIGLIAPILGKRRAQTVIDTVVDLEKVADTRALGALLGL